MGNIEKISDLLQKDELTYDEKASLDFILNGDPEARAFYNAYGSVKTAVRAGSHLSYDQIYNYILLKNGNAPEDKRVVVQLPLIEEHLRKCSLCLNEFSVLNAEYSEIENFIKTPDSDTIKNNIFIEPGKKTVRKFYAPRYSVVTVITIGILYLVLYFISGISTPDTYKYASLNEPEFYVTRGRPTDEFQKSIAALENREYEEAIAHLEKDISNNADDKTIFYSHYIMGLSYLETAENKFLGLFPSYSEEKVNAGLSHLEKAVELNNSGKFPNVTYDAYFYLAKGNLMLDNQERAIKYFRLVIENKGSKMQEAQSAVDVFGKLE
ncbi:MAG: hypothetical protein R6W90_14290 [Ignavibacteriaceae bacterium]